MRKKAQYKQLNKTWVSCGLLVLSFALFTGKSSAEEISVSVVGNGAGSENTVSTQNTTTATVEQSNQAEVDNTVEEDLNTGGNSVSSNLGGSTEITTGDANSNTTIANESINSNAAHDNSCQCSEGIDAAIEDNGADSHNTIGNNSTNTALVTQNNNAQITNNVFLSQNTGNNSADNNSGNVVITTGDISSVVTIKNSSINNSVADISKSLFTTTFIINGNGAGSVNVIHVNTEDKTNLKTHNYANIANNVSLFLNTGNNSANGNSGNVAINTGDIFSLINIINEGINSNVATIGCALCNPPGEVPEDPPTVPPGNTPHHDNPPDNNRGGSGGGSSSNGGSGSVLGAAIGEILPSTGTNWLFLMTLASFFIFLMGLYLRLHSGNSPGRVAYLAV